MSHSAQAPARHGACALWLRKTDRVGLDNRTGLNNVTASRGQPSFPKLFPMTKTHLLLVAALVLTPAVIFGQPKKDRPDTPIEKDMHMMGKAYRQLRKQVADPSLNASSLELVATIRKGAMDARTHTPLHAADFPEADRPGFEAKYRDKMGQFIDTVDRLAEALKAGRNDEAEKLTKKLLDLQKADHKDFRRPEKKKD